MQVWQRGTSYSGTPSSVAYGSVDRWAFYSTSPITASQSTSVPSGFQYSLKLQRPAAATTTAQLYTLQVIESVNMLDLAGQTVTLSFYAKAGANFSASGSLLSYGVGTGTVADEGSAGGLGGWTGSAAPISGNQALTTTWTRYFFTGVIGASALEMDAYFYYTPTGTAGADDSVYITGVQLETGSIATPYERQIYSDQLIQCQRYFSKSYLDGVTPGTSTNTGKNSWVSMGTVSTFMRYSQPFSVTMRAAPTTVAIYSTTGASGNVRLSNASDFAVTTEDAGALAFAFYGNRSWAAGDFVWWQWTASAEL